MKKLLLLYALMALALSCARQEENIPSGGSNATAELRASFADSPSRTAFVGAVFSWMNADRIRVAAEGGGTLDYKYTGPASSGEVTFSLNEETSAAVLLGDGGFALYPSLSEGNCTVAAGTMTLSLKNSYTWFDGNVEAPMISKVLPGEPLRFTQLGGLLMVEYANIPSDAAGLVVTTPGYEITSGLPVIGWDGSFVLDTPYVQAQAGSDGELRISFSPGSSSSKSFYVPLPVGPGDSHQYPKVKVYLADSGGSLIPGTMRTASNLQIERRTIKPMPEIPVPSQYSVTTLFGTKDRNTALASKAGGDYSSVVLGCPRGLGWINPGHTAFILDQNQNIRIWDLDSETVSEPHSYGTASYVPWYGTCKDGLVYFAEKAQGMVYSYNVSTGAFSQLRTGYSGKSPVDVKFDAAGNAYLAVWDNYAIYRFDGGDFSAEPSATYSFTDKRPMSMAFDPYGDLIVTTNGGQVIRVDTVTGDMDVIAGVKAANTMDDGTSGRPRTAKFTNNLNSVVVTSGGVIYVGDNYRLRKIVPGPAGYVDAVVSTVAGSTQAAYRSVADGIGTAATFNSFGGMMLSPDESVLYMTEQTGGYVRQIFLGNADASAAPLKKLRTATFNIRFITDKDTGDRAWDVRKSKVLRLIQDYGFDVIGFQESTTDQRTYLKSQLPGYSFQESGYEEPCIAWKTSRFSKLGWGQFWLSPNPDTPNSKPGSPWIDVTIPRSRICIWVKLHDSVTGRDIVFMNTHLEVYSSGIAGTGGLTQDELEERCVTVREKSADLIIERAASISGGSTPTILVGDMNSSTTEAGNVKLKAYFTDAYYDDLLVDTNWKTGTVATYNAWTDTDEQAAKWYHRMDDVYFKWGFKPLSYRVIRRNYDGVMPSDHWPVTVDFIVN